MNEKGRPFLSIQSVSQQPSPDVWTRLLCLLGWVGSRKTKVDGTPFRLIVQLPLSPKLTSGIHDQGELFTPECSTLRSGDVSLLFVREKVHSC